MPELHNQQTTIQYILNRMFDLGVTDFFGVPGDVVYPVLDAICDDPRLNWIGNCNELNAAYSADGYARVKGAAACCSTYGAGELSATNGIAGAYSEFSTIFHFVGMPPKEQEGLVTHHMLKQHSRDKFAKMTAELYCATTIISADNCIEEIERVIAAALYHRRPVYIGMPWEVTNQFITATQLTSQTPLTEAPHSNPTILDNAVKDIVARINKAKQPCLLPGIYLARAGLKNSFEQLVNNTNLPFVTGCQDKGVCDETNPNYAGMYMGKLNNLATFEYMQGCDCHIVIAAFSNTFNSGFFTINPDPATIINIRPHKVIIGDTVYPNIEIKDVLAALNRHLSQQPTDFSNVARVNAIELNGEVTVGAQTDPISGGTPLFARLAQFIQPNDIVVGDPGGVVLGLLGMKLPKGAIIENQIQWGSIGWGIPASFGASVASPDRRIVLVGGEGAHQMSVQEISQFQRQGLKPVIIVVNNDGYLVERYTARNPEEQYNNLTQWHYSELPKTLGCIGWQSSKVTTYQELDNALSAAQHAKTGVYIEVITKRYALPPCAEMIFNATRAKFGQQTSWQQWIKKYDQQQ